MRSTAFSCALAATMVLAVATGHVQAQVSRNLPFNRTLEIPLYEEFPVIRDYRLNQSIQGAIRWATLAPFAGAAFGTLMLHGGVLESYWAGALGATAIGIPLGATMGFIKGQAWEEHQGGSRGYYSKRLHFGYELEAGGGLTTGHGGMALSYRMTSVPVGPVPNEFQLAYQRNSASSASISNPDLEAHDTRYSLRFIRNFRDKLINPFVGVAVGYADGYYDGFEEELSPISSALPDSGKAKPTYRSPFVDVMAGIKFNVFDLVHARTQVSYEPYGPYYERRRKGAFSYLSNFALGFSLGTYIF